MPIVSVLKGLLHKNNERQPAASAPVSTAAGATSSAPHSSSTSRQPAASSDVNPSIAHPPAAHLAPVNAKSLPVTGSTPANASAPTGQAMAASNAGHQGGAAAAAAQNATSQGTHAQAEEIVRKENEAKAKREQSVFDGLPDGLTLGRKMGDGAFSNVFEATYRPSPAQLAVDPKLAKEVKVAVKCVRKFELNSSQVRVLFFSFVLSYFPTPSSLAHVRVIAPLACLYFALPSFSPLTELHASDVHPPSRAAHFPDSEGDQRRPQTHPRPLRRKSRRQLEY